MTTTPAPAAAPGTDVARSRFSPVTRRAVNDAIMRSLLAGHTWEATAEAAGCSVRTVARRASDPDFAAELRRRQGEALAQTRRRIAALAGRALDALESVIDDADSPAARVAAARVILDRLDPVPVDVRVSRSGPPPARQTMAEQFTELRRRLGVIDAESTDTTKESRLMPAARNGHNGNGHNGNGATS